MLQTGPLSPVDENVINFLARSSNEQLVHHSSTGRSPCFIAVGDVQSLLAGKPVVDVVLKSLLDDALHGVAETLPDGRRTMRIQCCLQRGQAAMRIIAEVRHRAAGDGSAVLPAELLYRSSVPSAAAVTEKARPWVAGSLSALFDHRLDCTVGPTRFIFEEFAGGHAFGVCIDVLQGGVIEVQVVDGMHNDNMESVTQLFEILSDLWGHHHGRLTTAQLPVPKLDRARITHAVSGPKQLRLSQNCMLVLFFAVLNWMRGRVVDRGTAAHAECARLRTTYLRECRAADHSAPGNVLAMRLRSQVLSEVTSYDASMSFNLTEMMVGQPRLPQADAAGGSVQNTFRTFFYVYFTDGGILMVGSAPAASRVAAGEAMLDIRNFWEQVWLAPASARSGLLKPALSPRVAAPVDTLPAVAPLGPGGSGGGTAPELITLIATNLTGVAAEAAAAAVVAADALVYESDEEEGTVRDVLRLKAAAAAAEPTSGAEYMPMFPGQQQSGPAAAAAAAALPLGQAQGDLAPRPTPRQPLDAGVDAFVPSPVQDRTPPLNVSFDFVHTEVLGNPAGSEDLEVVNEEDFGDVEVPVVTAPLHVVVRPATGRLEPIGVCGARCSQMVTSAGKRLDMCECPLCHRIVPEDKLSPHLKGTKGISHCAFLQQVLLHGLSVNVALAATASASSGRKNRFGIHDACGLLFMAPQGVRSHRCDVDPKVRHHTNKAPAVSRGPPDPSRRAPVWSRSGESKVADGVKRDMPVSVVEYATPDGAVCAAGFMVLKNCRLVRWLLANEDEILLLPHDRNNLEGVVLTAGMRSWSRAARWMVGHTGGIMGYMYLLFDGVAKIAMAPFLKGAERKEAVLAMSDGYPFNVAEWILVAASGYIAAERAKCQSRVAEKAAARGFAASYVAPMISIEEDLSGLERAATDPDNDDEDMLLVTGPAEEDEVMAPALADPTDNRRPDTQARTQEDTAWDNSDGALRALFQSPFRLTSRAAVVDDRFIVYATDLGETDQVGPPTTLTLSTRVEVSSDDCVVNLVDGPTTVALVLQNAASALCLQQYVSLWLGRGLVGQHPPLCPGRSVLPSAPSRLHPGIEMAYGWFGFHNGLEGLQWVPWSEIRNVATESEEMLVTVTVDSGASWSFRCPSFGNATAVARVITGCSCSPRAEQTLHASIRIIGYALCLGDESTDAAARQSLDWQSIGVVHVDAPRSLSISTAASVAAPGEPRTFSFPDGGALTLAVAWIEWWWNLRLCTFRPGETLCHLVAAPMALDTAQQLVESHSGLLRHVEIPAKPPCETQKDLAQEKSRRAAAKRSALEGDVNRANACLTTNAPRRDMDDTTFGQLAALQLRAPVHPEPLCRMPGTATPIITAEGIHTVISAINARAAAGPSGATNRLYKQVLSPKVAESDRYWIMQGILQVVSTIAAGAEEGVLYAAGVPAHHEQLGLFSRWIRRARAVALGKLRKPGLPVSAPDPIRPIAVGETLYRIALRVIYNAVGNKRIMGALLPCQFGVGDKAGVETMLAKLRELYESGIAILCLDMTNAFNAVHRSSIENPIRNHLPELAKAMHFTIGTPSDLLVRMDDGSIRKIISDTGVRQGCPFSSLGFSASVRAPITALAARVAARFLISALAQGRFDLLSPADAPAALSSVVDGDEPMPAMAPGAVSYGPGVAHHTDGSWWRLRDDILAFIVSAYIDDTYVLTLTADDAAAARTDAAEIFGAHGLELNIPKCHLVHRLTFERDGSVEGVLGAHLGNDKVVSRLLMEKVSDAERALGRLCLWHEWGDTHLALLILRLCTLPKFAYPVRTETPSAVFESQERVGGLVLATLRALTNMDRDFTYQEVVYITNPLVLGGGGFSSILNFIHGLPYGMSAVIAHAGLRSKKISLNVERLPGAVDSIARGAYNLSGSLDLGSSPSVAKMLDLHPQRLVKLTKRATRRFYLRRTLPFVLEYTQNPTARNLYKYAQTLEHSTPLGSAWLSCIPGRSISFLPSAVITTALRAQFLVESVYAPRSNMICACGCVVAPDVPVGGDAIGMDDRWDMERELAGSSVQTFSQHADRCVKSAVIRANLHDGVVGDMASAFRAGGNVVVLEETYNKTNSGDRADVTVAPRTLRGPVAVDVAPIPPPEPGQSELRQPEEQAGSGSIINVFPPLAAPRGRVSAQGEATAAILWLDFSCTALKLLVGGRPLVPCPLVAVDSAEEERGFKSMWEAAKTAAFASVTKRAKEKWAHHGGMVLPLVVSTGGGIFADADALLPQAPSDSMARSYCRQKISCRLVHFLAVRQAVLHTRLAPGRGGLDQVVYS